MLLNLLDKVHEKILNLWLFEPAEIREIQKITAPHEVRKKDVTKFGRKAWQTGKYLDLYCLEIAKKKEKTEQNKVAFGIMPLKTA